MVYLWAMHFRYNFVYFLMLLTPYISRAQADSTAQVLEDVFRAKDKIEQQKIERLAVLKKRFAQAPMSLLATVPTNEILEIWEL